jgi:hypothetical protein
MRLNNTVASESAIIECGSRYSWLATSRTALPGSSAAASRLPAFWSRSRSAPGMVAMRITYRKASCPTAAVRSVQTLSFAAWPSPTPRQPKRGRRPSLSLKTGIRRMAVWAMTPSVEKPATRKVWLSPQLSSVWGLATLAPKIQMNMPRPSMATTLFRMGAHMAGPKAPLAFRTCVRSA